MKGSKNARESALWEIEKSNLLQTDYPAEERTFLWRGNDTKRMLHPFALRSRDFLKLPVILSGGKDTNKFQFQQNLFDVGANFNDN